MPAARDTIVALATPAGPAARAIVRLSGPGTADAVRAVVASPEGDLPPPNRLMDGSLSLPGIHSPVPATLYFWRGPRSYTGEDVAEIHLVGAMPLVEALVAALLGAGCRAAGPGEFTQRAFLSGKLDLTRAEAVHAVIEAADRIELRQALGQLAGGVARPMAELREDLLNLLADVEAGLDFADEHIEIVSQRDSLLRLTAALAHVTLIGKQLEGRSLTRRAFRVALAGRPNAGKSSLFNALTGSSVLVSDQPGTTRDYLTATLRLGATEIELIDTPGRQAATDGIESQAQTLASAQQAEADLVLVCVEAGEAIHADEAALLRTGQPSAVLVWTKSDRERPSEARTSVSGREDHLLTCVARTEGLSTSAITGAGLVALRDLLARAAAAQAQPALAPSVSRCKHHVKACLEHLRRAHSIVLEEDPPEILALELREALHQLGEMAGAVYTDDLLDRIFSRFCIGK